MTYQEYVKATVLKMDQEIFEMLKTALVGEYLNFFVIDASGITKEILSEKLCDYFEKLELKPEKLELKPKNFDKYLEGYISDLDEVVGNRIAKPPRAKKKDSNPAVIPRARKFYDKAMNVKNTRVLTDRQLLDYTRIMLCLYSEIIKNNYAEISNMNYSVSSIDPDVIITSMKKEEDKLKKPKFNIKDLYCQDTCTFIIAMINMYKIIGDKVQGEYYHE